MPELLKITLCASADQDMFLAVMACLAKVTKRALNPSLYNCYREHHKDVKECTTTQLCSHGCMEQVGGYTCTCPVGLFIGPDQQTCTGKETW